MTFFDRSPAKLLKKLRKYAEEGNLTRIEEIVKEEREYLIEDAENSLLLTDFLLEVGFPETALFISFN